MPLYPEEVARCQHIRVNGTQCGSPALRNEKRCFFHERWYRNNVDARKNYNKPGMITLPTLEDANSVQVGLAELLRLLAANRIDHRTAALMLYALQTASANVKHTSFQPDPTRVVIDRDSVERRPLGASAWSAVAGREYDELTEGVPAIAPSAGSNSSSTSTSTAGAREQDIRTANYLASKKGPEVSELAEPWRPPPPVPEEERLLPGECQRDRFIRVRKQKGLETDLARLDNCVATDTAY